MLRMRRTRGKKEGKRTFLKRLDVKVKAGVGRRGRKRHRKGRGSKVGEWSFEGKEGWGSVGLGGRRGQRVRKWRGTLDWCYLGECMGGRYGLWWVQSSTEGRDEL